MSGSKIGKLFDNRRFLLVFSIVFSVVIWFISMFTIKENNKVTLRDVPVHIDSSSTIMQRLNLDAVDIDQRSVDVVIEGKPYVIGNITADDVEVSAVLAGITEQGTYNLNLIANKVTGSTKDFQIVDISPQSIAVKFDHMVTVKIPIQPEVVGAEVPEGYIMQSYIVNPSEISVTGPKTDVERIKGCVVTAVVNDVVNKTTNVTSQLVLIDENANAIENRYITTDITSAEITVPILKKKELPLRVDFINAPPGFQEKDFDYTLSLESIEIAGSQSVVDNLNEVLLGYVDFKTLNAQTEYSFNLTLPASVVNLHNIETVDLDFERDDMITKSFTVKDIRVVNAPAGYDVKVSSTQVRNVKMTGYKSAIDSLLATDLIAEVDISSRELTTGQLLAPVRIFAPSKSGVWANGDYSVMLTVREKA